VIELLLQAERALAMGLVDQAERLYAQAVAADPRNSIAVVGLARVALERTDDAEAYRLAMQALGIDPENAAAARLVGRLEEVYAARGLPAPGTEGDPAVAPVVAAASVPAPVAGAAPPAADLAPPEATPDSVPAPGPSPSRRSLLDRLLRRNRP